MYYTVLSPLVVPVIHSHTHFGGLFCHLDAAFISCFSVPSMVLVLKMSPGIPVNSLLTVLHHFHTGSTLHVGEQWLLPWKHSYVGAVTIQGYFMGFFCFVFSFLYAHLTTLLVLHPMVSAEIKPQRVAKQIIFDPDSVRANIQMFSFLWMGNFSIQLLHWTLISHR